jgi:predicted CopG family antitoxin
MKERNTTIWISKETKKKLLKQKNYPRETFDDIINRLIESYEKSLGEKNNGTP